MTNKGKPIRGKLKGFTRLDKDGISSTDENGKPIMITTTIGDSSINTITGGTIYTGTTGVAPITSTFPTMTSTSSGPFVFPTPLTPKARKMPRVIQPPTRIGRKMLIAFLDDDDNVEWCAKVYPEDYSVDSSYSELPQMTVNFKLVDANPEPKPADADEE